jgi:hypothetical protein
MNSGRLFDLIFRCERPIAVASLAATIVLSACAPEDNRIAAAIQSGSDWMNNVEQAPPPKPWRLSQRPGLTDGAYPSLADVPERPTNLPDPAEVNAKIAALRQDDSSTAAMRPQRPDAASLGSPPPATVAPISIPRSSAPARRPTPIPAQPSAAAPAPIATTAAPAPASRDVAALPPPADIRNENSLVLDAEEPQWFTQDARAQVAAFAQSQSTTNSLILLMVEGPEFSDDTVNPIRNQLISSGIPEDRISVNFRIASLRKVRLRTLGQ